MTTSAIGKRQKQPDVIEGKTAPVRGADVEAHQAAKAELARLQSRIGRLTRKIKAQMGNAQIGLDEQGRPVVWREVTRTGRHYVRQNWRDDLRPGGPDQLDLDLPEADLERMEAGA